MTLTLTVTDAVGATDFSTDRNGAREPAADGDSWGTTRPVGGGDMVDLTPAVEDPEDDNLVYEWAAAPDVGHVSEPSDRTRSVDLDGAGRRPATRRWWC